MWFFKDLSNPQSPKKLKMDDLDNQISDGENEKESEVSTLEYLFFTVWI